jgi:excisionase family DNA binding protein
MSNQLTETEAATFPLPDVTRQQLHDYRQIAHALSATRRRRNDEIPAELPDLTKPQLHDYGQAARVTGLSVPTLERYVRNGKLRPVPGLGRSVRFSSAELLRLINS